MGFSAAKGDSLEDQSLLPTRVKISPARPCHVHATHDVAGLSSGQHRRHFLATTCPEFDATQIGDQLPKGVTFDDVFLDPAFCLMPK